MEAAMTLYFVLAFLYMFVEFSVCVDLMPLKPKFGSYCFNCQVKTIANLTCSANERIAFKGIFYGAKRTPESCKFNQTEECTELNQCCRMSVQNDCAVTTEKDYYSRCIGQRQCSITFINDTMTCPDDVDITVPNYVGVSYYCVPANLVNLEGNSNASSKVVSLMNRNYPAAVSKFTSIRCSIETTCWKVINIVALDVYFDFKVNEGCSQELVITDGSESVKKDCHNNNHFRTAAYYTSTSNFLILNFTNKIQTMPAYVWMMVKESTSTEEVSVRCGDKAAEKGSYCRNFPRVIATAKPQLTKTTIVTTTEQTTEDPNPGKPSTAGNVDDTQLKYIVLSVLLVVIVAVAVVFGICYYKKTNQTKISPEEDVVVTASSKRILPKPSPILTSGTRTLGNRQQSVDEVNTSRSSLVGALLPRRQHILPPLPTLPALPKYHMQRAVLPDIGMTDHSPLQTNHRRALPKIVPRVPSDQCSDEDDV